MSFITNDVQPLVGQGGLINNLKVFDLVEIIESPYEAIKVGTVTRITKIIPKHFKGWHRRWDADCYILGGLEYKYFREHELKKV